MDKDFVVARTGVVTRINNLLIEDPERVKRAIEATQSLEVAVRRLHDEVDGGLYSDENEMILAIEQVRAWRPSPEKTVD